jgi:hypothetical protein
MPPPARPCLPSPHLRSLSHHHADAPPSSPRRARQCHAPVPICDPHITTPIPPPSPPHRAQHGEDDAVRPFHRPSPPRHARPGDCHTPWLEFRAPYTLLHDITADLSYQEVLTPPPRCTCARRRFRLPELPITPISSPP